MCRRFDSGSAQFKSRTLSRDILNDSLCQHVILAIRVPSKIAFIAFIVSLATVHVMAAPPIPPNTNELSNRLHAIRDRLPGFKRDLDELKTAGWDDFFPLDGPARLCIGWGIDAPLA
jgi:hypothetical protein